jgi:hypothetical protein
MPGLLRTDILLAFLTGGLLLCHTVLCAVPDPTWPSTQAPMVLRIVKTSGFEIDTEKQWMHLHSDPGNLSAQRLGLTVQVSIAAAAVPSCCSLYRH